MDQRLRLVFIAQRFARRLVHEVQQAAGWACHGVVSIGAFAGLCLRHPNLDVGTSPGTEDRDLGHEAGLRRPMGRRVDLSQANGFFSHC
jgi:hypothetical protein